MVEHAGTIRESLKKAIEQRRISPLMPVRLSSGSTIPLHEILTNDAHLADPAVGRLHALALRHEVITLRDLPGLAASTTTIPSSWKSYDEILADRTREVRAAELQGTAPKQFIDSLRVDILAQQKDPASRLSTTATSDLLRNMFGVDRASSAAATSDEFDALRETSLGISHTTQSVLQIGLALHDNKITTKDQLLTSLESSLQLLERDITAGMVKAGEGRTVSNTIGELLVEVRNLKTADPAHEELIIQRVGLIVEKLLTTSDRINNEELGFTEEHPGAKQIKIGANAANLLGVAYLGSLVLVGALEGYSTVGRSLNMAANAALTFYIVQAQFFSGILHERQDTKQTEFGAMPTRFRDFAKGIMARRAFNSLDMPSLKNELRDTFKSFRVGEKYIQALRYIRMFSEAVDDVQYEIWGKMIGLRRIEAKAIEMSRRTYDILRKHGVNDMETANMIGFNLAVEDFSFPSDHILLDVAQNYEALDKAILFGRRTGDSYGGEHAIRLTFQKLFADALETRTYSNGAPIADSDISILSELEKTEVLKIVDPNLRRFISDEEFISICAQFGMSTELIETLLKKKDSVLKSVLEEIAVSSKYSEDNAKEMVRALLARCKSENHATKMAELGNWVTKGLLRGDIASLSSDQTEKIVSLIKVISEEYNLPTEVAREIVSTLRNDTISIEVRAQQRNQEFTTTTSEWCKGHRLAEALQGIAKQGTDNGTPGLWRERYLYLTDPKSQGQNPTSPEIKELEALFSELKINGANKLIGAERLADVRPVNAEKKANLMEALAVAFHDSSLSKETAALIADRVVKYLTINKPYGTPWEAEIETEVQKGLTVEQADFVVWQGHLEATNLEIDAIISREGITLLTDQVAKVKDRVADELNGMKGIQDGLSRGLAQMVKKEVEGVIGTIDSLFTGETAKLDTATTQARAIKTERKTIEWELLTMGLMIPVTASSFDENTFTTDQQNHIMEILLKKGYIDTAGNLQTKFTGEKGCLTLKEDFTPDEEKKIFDALVSARSVFFKLIEGYFKRLCTKDVTSKNNGIFQNPPRFHAGFDFSKEEAAEKIAELLFGIKYFGDKVVSHGIDVETVEPMNNMARDQRAPLTKMRIIAADDMTKAVEELKLKIATTTQSIADSKKEMAELAPKIAKLKEAGERLTGDEAKKANKDAIGALTKESKKLQGIINGLEEERSDNQKKLAETEALLTSIDRVKSLDPEALLQAKDIVRRFILNFGERWALMDDLTETVRHASIAHSGNAEIMQSYRTLSEQRGALTKLINSLEKQELVVAERQWSSYVKRFGFTAEILPTELAELSSLTPTDDIKKSFATLVTQMQNGKAPSFLLSEEEKITNELSIVTSQAFQSSQLYSGQSERTMAQQLLTTMEIAKGTSPAELRTSVMKSLDFSAIVKDSTLSIAGGLDPKIKAPLKKVIHEIITSRPTEGFTRHENEAYKNSLHQTMIFFDTLYVETVEGTKAAQDGRDMGVFVDENVMQLSTVLLQELAKNDTQMPMRLIRDLDLNFFQNIRLADSQADHERLELEKGFLSNRALESLLRFRFDDSGNIRRTITASQAVDQLLEGYQLTGDAAQKAQDLRHILEFYAQEIFVRAATTPYLGAISAAYNFREAKRNSGTLPVFAKAYLAEAEKRLQATDYDPNGGHNPSSRHYNSVLQGMIREIRAQGLSTYEEKEIIKSIKAFERKMRIDRKTGGKLGAEYEAAILRARDAQLIEAKRIAEKNPTVININATRELLSHLLPTTTNDQVVSAVEGFGPIFTPAQKETILKIGFQHTLKLRNLTEEFRQRLEWEYLYKGRGAWHTYPTNDQLQSGLDEAKQFVGEKVQVLREQFILRPGQQYSAEQLMTMILTQQAIPHIRNEMGIRKELSLRAVKVSRAIDRLIAKGEIIPGEQSYGEMKSIAEAALEEQKGTVEAAKELAVWDHENTASASKNILDFSRVGKVMGIFLKPLGLKYEYEVDKDNLVFRTALKKSIKFWRTEYDELVKEWRSVLQTQQCYFGGGKSQLIRAQMGTSYLFMYQMGSVLSKHGMSLIMGCFINKGIERIARGSYFSRIPEIRRKFDEMLINYFGLERTNKEGGIGEVKPIFLRFKALSAIVAGFGIMGIGGGLAALTSPHVLLGLGAISLIAGLTTGIGTGSFKRGMFFATATTILGAFAVPLVLGFAAAPISLLGGIAGGAIFGSTAGLNALKATKKSEGWYKALNIGLPIVNGALLGYTLGPVYGLAAAAAGELFYAAHESKTVRGFINSPSWSPFMARVFARNEKWIMPSLNLLSFGAISAMALSSGAAAPLAAVYGMFLSANVRYAPRNINSFTREKLTRVFEPKSKHSELKETRLPIMPKTTHTWLNERVFADYILKGVYNSPPEKDSEDLAHTIIEMKSGDATVFQEGVDGLAGPVNVQYGKRGQMERWDGGSLMEWSMNLYKHFRYRQIMSDSNWLRMIQMNLGPAGAVPRAILNFSLYAFTGLGSLYFTFDGDSFSSKLAFGAFIGLGYAQYLVFMQNLKNAQSLKGILKKHTNLLLSHLEGLQDVRLRKSLERAMPTHRESAVFNSTVSPKYIMETPPDHMTFNAENWTSRAYAAVGLTTVGLFSMNFLYGMTAGGAERWYPLLLMSLPFWIILPTIRLREARKLSADGNPAFGKYSEALKTVNTIAEDKKMGPHQAKELLIESQILRDKKYFERMESEFQENHQEKTTFLDRH